MWQVDNRTPFAAERGWVRDRNGAEVWLVAVKCTFAIELDGSTRVAEDQPPVLRIAEYNGEPGRSSIRCDADLILTKSTTDVVVTGHAWAPDGRAVTELEVGFRVGPVQKVLRVFGDRSWTIAGCSSPRPFLQMPLVYERAFGGIDRRSQDPDRDFEWRNPVGTGFAVSRENLTGIALPNVEYPDQLISTWQDRPQPAGFGPIASHWQPRVGFAGTYDDNWLKKRQPLLPEDFDLRFFQSVPPDQQSPQFLRGGESAMLHRLTRHGDLKFVLPKVFLGFETEFYDGTTEIHTEKRLHTVIIDADVPQVSLIWHSALPCHFKVQKLRRTIVKMKTNTRAGDLA